MADFLRQLLLPIVLCTIVSTVWIVGWSRNLESQSIHENRPTKVETVVAGTQENWTERTLPHLADAEK